MNYKKRDDELIKLNKQIQAKKYGYTEEALNKLKAGTYGSTRVPMLKQNTAPNKASEMTTTGNKTTKPSTRYQNQTAGQTTPKQSTRDTRYDNDFNEFHKYRVGDKIGVMDYDTESDREVEHWRNLKNEIMAKNKWTEKEFDTKWDEYYKERSQKEANQEVSDAVKFAEKHPILGTLLQGVYTPQNMIEGGAAMLSNLAPEKYKAQSADDTLFTGTRAKEGIKQTVKDEHIDTGVGKALYDIGTSVGDMALGAAIPVLGTASLGTQAAARSNMQALERGVDPNKAAATGAASGLVSGFMNKVGLDKALGAAGKTAAGTVGKAALREGAENVLEDSANLLIDQAINTDKSQYSAMRDYYISQGMTDDEASTQAAKDIVGDLATSAASGAAFGGLMSAGRNLPALKDMFLNRNARKRNIQNVPTDTNKIRRQLLALPENDVEADRQAILDNIQRYRNGELQASEHINMGGTPDYLSDFGDTSLEIGLRQKKFKDMTSPKNDPEHLHGLSDEQVADFAYDKNAPLAVFRSSEVPNTPVIVGDRVDDNGAPIVSALNMDAVNTQKYIDKNLLRSLYGKDNIAYQLQEARDTNNMLFEHKDKVDKIISDKGLQSPPPNNPTNLSDSNVLPNQGNVNSDLPYLKGQQAPGTERAGSIFDLMLSMPGQDIDTSYTAGNGDINGTDISRRYETLRNSDLFQKSEANMKMLDTAKEQGIFNKDVENRTLTRQEALEDYLNDPEKAVDRNLNRAWDSGKDVDTSMLILHDALDANDQAFTNLVLLKQAEQSKAAGRSLRAMRDYAGTKEATIQKAGEYLNDIADRALSSKKESARVDSIAERVTSGDRDILTQKLDMDDENVRNIEQALGAGASKSDIAKMIAMYEKVGKTGVSQEALEKVNAIYKIIDDMKLNPTSRQRAELEADAFKILAQDIGGKRTWREQWNSWRYLAMLGNPKTHLRNILGNTTHRMVTEVKDNIGAVLESAVDMTSKAAGGEGIDRTKSLLGVNDRELIKSAADDADNVAYGALNDMGNKYNVKSEIDRARNSFNNKALSKVDEFNSSLLDKEDYSALKRKYSKSLARFLKANGADESIFTATDEASKALLDKGRAYAIDQAKQATFHEYSKLAESLTRFSQEQREGGIGNKALGMAVEGLLPFKKTPINILKQGVKYSPYSLAKSIGTMATAVRTGNKTASDAIDDLASGLTGTGVMALGAFLADKGILTGSANPDYDVDNAETEQGAQNYALKIGNNSYTLDWLAPVSLPLFVGAELMNLYKNRNSDEGNLDRILSAMATIAEPITEMSMLDGLQNVLNELSYSKDNPIGTVLTNSMLGYVGQGIPTLSGQIARAIDGTRRSTYTDQPAGYKRQVDKAIIKNKNKIPFLSMTNEPYIDTKGQTQQTEGLATNLIGNNFATRLADQMLSPGYFKHGTVTEQDKELNRLYDLTGESLYKDISNGKVGDKKLSKKEFTKYQTLYGQNMNAFYDALIGSNAYKRMDSNEQRADAIKEAKRVAKMIADHEIGGKEIKANSADELIYDIYKKEGAKGVEQYLNDYSEAKSKDMSYKTYKEKETKYEGGAKQYAEDKAKADELGLRVDTYKKKEAEYKGGAAKYAEDKKSADELGIKPESYNKIKERAGSNADKVINAVPELNRAGLDGTNAYLTYAQALNEVPSLTPSEFSRTFNTIDTDHSKGIKQDELIAYFNNNHFTSEEQAMKVWRMYAPEGKKLPYLKKNGTWGKH